MKISKLHTIPKTSWVFIAIFVLSILVATIAINNQNNKITREAVYEQKMYENLDNRFMTIKTSFNQINEGWTYTRSCSSKRGKWEQDAASHCQLTIYNETSNPEAIKANFDSYAQLLKSDFEMIHETKANKELRLKDESQRAHRYTKYQSHDGKVNCALSEYYSDEYDPSSQEGGVSFYCMSLATKFHFPRDY